MVCDQTIVSLSDSGLLAKRCARHYVATVREVLRDGVWRCARRRVSLAPKVEKPGFQWQNQFQLPPDFIRTISINGIRVGEPDCPEFEVEGRLFLANLDMVQLSFVRDITQEGSPSVLDLDPLCEEAIAKKLASKLAWLMQQSRTLRESLLQEYDVIIRKARNANSRDAFEKTLSQGGVTSSWLGGRY